MYVADVIGDVDEVQFFSVAAGLGDFLKEINKCDGDVESFDFLVFDHIEEETDEFQQVEPIFLAPVHFVDGFDFVPVQNIYDLFDIVFLHEGLTPTVPVPCEMQYLLDDTIRTHLLFCFLL